MRTRMTRGLLRRCGGAALTVLGSFGAGTTDAASTARHASIPRLATSLHPVTAYVINTGSGTVTPIRAATGKVLKAIKVGIEPDAIMTIGMRDGCD
jgi:YVTN family beta-propeller protein